MLKKQLIVIITALVLTATLAVVYFTVISPMLSTEEEKEIPELIQGEEFSDSYNKIMVFPSVEKEDIREIKIHNDHGDFGFFMDSDGEFYMTDYKATPCKSSNLTSLISSVRLPMAIERITTDVSDPEKYGLGEDAAYYILIDAENNEHKVYIGDVIPSGGGYYAMYEGRDAVYALDKTTSYILNSPESYVTPILAMPTSQQDYYMIDRFTLSVNSTPFVSIEMMDEKERKDAASISYYRMLEPADYVPSTSNYDELLKTFQAFEGTQVLAFGDVTKAMTPEELAPFGLENPKYEIYYRYKDVDNYVLVSEQLEDGSYNAYSVMFNIVANVTEEKLKFLNWRFLDFVEKPMFQKNINDMQSIEIIGADLHETFTIEGSDQTLSVTPESTGKLLNPNDLASFKKLYIKLLSLAIEDYSDSTSTDEWVMTFKVKTRGGIETEYSFYNYSTRRCFFTVNGEGEFYVLRDRVEKILSDTKTLMAGGEITSDPS